MDDWKAYMEKHHKEWIKYAEFEFATKMKSDEIILIRGWIKTKKWVIATMESAGNYSLDIETTGYMQATLKLDNKEIVGGVRYGSDRSSAQERTLRDLAAQMGQIVDPEFKTPRTRCLFILGLKLEKDFWAPKRIVAAGEPRDPGGSNDEDIYPFSARHTAQGTWRPTSSAYTVSLVDCVPRVILMTTLNRRHFFPT